MVSMYRQLKESVGLSNRDSDGGKLARLKSELKALDDKIPGAAPEQRGVLRELHKKASQHVGARDVAKAETAVRALSSKLDGTTPLVGGARLPTPDEVGLQDDERKLFANQAYDAVFQSIDTFYPQDLDGWKLKIARWSAFLEHYAGVAEAAALRKEVETTQLPWARQQKELLMVQQESIDVEQKRSDAKARQRRMQAYLTDIPMAQAFKDIRAIHPATVSGWAIKIAQLEAFYDTYKDDPDARANCQTIELELLPEAMKQKTVLEAEAIYVENVNKKGDQALEPFGTGNLNEKEMQTVMQKTGLSEAEILAIKIFTAADYKYINPVVANQKDQKGYGKGKKNPWLDTHVKGQNKKTDDAERAYIAKSMDAAAANGGMLFKAVKKLTPVRAKLYRGQRMTQGEFNDFVKKGRIRVEAFQSNSTSLKAAKEFGHVAPDPTLSANKTICLLTEAEVISARDIQELSLVPGEQELLLMPDTVLEIQGAPIRESQQDYNGFPAHPKVPALQWFRILLKEVGA